jgi:hypothetical protein
MSNKTHGMTEYIFSVNMKLGFDITSDDANCKARLCTARVVGTWNGKTMQASERFDITCIDGYPYSSFLSISTLVTCPADPWITNVGIVKNAVSCSAPTVTGAAPFGKVMTIYPLTAAYMSWEGRDMIARSVPGWGTGSFVLPPAMPPEVCVGICMSDSFDFRHGEDAKITIKRPSDGSPQWYKKPWKYDVEFEVKQGGKMAIAGWMKKTLVPSVPGADPANFTVPYLKFFNDPDDSWDITTFGDKKYRAFRVHARVHDDAATHPWSEWRRFFMEIPKRELIAPTTKTGKNLPLGR